jgi:hypothetical protein
VRHQMTKTIARCGSSSPTTWCPRCSWGQLAHHKTCGVVRGPGVGCAETKSRTSCSRELVVCLDRRPNAPIARTPVPNTFDSRGGPCPAVKAPLDWSCRHAAASTRPVLLRFADNPLRNVESQLKIPVSQGFQRASRLPDALNTRLESAAANGAMAMDAPATTVASNGAANLGFSVMAALLNGWGLSGQAMSRARLPLFAAR